MFATGIRMKTRFLKSFRVAWAFRFEIETPGLKP
jgi:hypothetical protein